MTRRITHRKKKTNQTKKRANSKPDVLSADQLKFISEYIILNSTRVAAERAKVDERTARRWLALPIVKKEIKWQKEELRKKTGYNLEALMEEAEAAIKFAKQKGNANAYVKAIELKGKANALLIDKQHMVMETPYMVKIVGLEKPPAIAPPATENIRVVEQLPESTEVQLTEEEEAML